MNFPTMKSYFLIAILIFQSVAFAQEIIPETVEQQIKTADTGQRQKIDGIIATVGDYTILDSDIDKSFLEISSQGNSIKDITRCQMLGKLLEDKLYAHQAIQDSIKVTDAEIKSMMDERIEFMTQQIGSIDKVVQYYGKSDLEDFKSYFFDILKENKLSSEMQKKIVSEVKITPEEVRTFFKKIPKDELPLLGAELEVAQIVILPKMSDAEKQKVIDKLNGFKKEIESGASSFATKAVLYSQDPGSRSSGGYYKMNRKTPFVKEFKDVAFSLKEGEISEPFQTEFGYHIIYLEKIKGQDLDLRHILLTPSTSNEDLKEAKEKADLLRKRIIDKEIDFAEAARTFSDEKETRANGGTLINPQTQDTHFELTKMDPVLYSQVSSIKDNSVSDVILDDANGKKKYKIITVTNRIDEHVADYAKDYIKIKDLALKEKQILAIGKWFDEKINETYIKIVGEYRDCDFTNNWLKINTNDIK